MLHKFSIIFLFIHIVVVSKIIQLDFIDFKHFPTILRLFLILIIYEDIHLINIPYHLNRD